ncbi:putative adhesion G protein-coupled receptor E4P [Haliotis rubra]|uniref:putative adhesion G protein-coupled receptor E4P n=1 Tax=Haliotis rubra TaxID=36100 RepID=UPI001EE62DA7|nr:putative adhesion G protein-coupled receptor E4P [Haliotis rubra]
MTFTTVHTKNGSNVSLVSASVLAKQILSVVCVSLSLICLLLTFITYCVFPTLRSLPGKNNMFLVGCLFLAQLLFQFGIDRTENNIVCTIIGVFIHFMWLCVMFWMNVCSFHMLRVFAVQNIIPQSRTRHTKALLRYSLYAFGSAALVVAVTVTVSSVLSGGTDVGYGGIVCYLTSNKLVGFSFVLPLSVIVMMNLTFFVVTIRAISKIENIKKHHGMKERHNVYVYIKLSSLTGMFWIVAILAEVFQQDVLIYISIILNGSLGVLLFICYIANRRVYDLWKGIFNKLRPKRPLEDSRNATVSTSI